MALAARPAFEIANRRVAIDHRHTLGVTGSEAIGIQAACRSCGYATRVDGFGAEIFQHRMTAAMRVDSLGCKGKGTVGGDGGDPCSEQSY